MKVTLERSGDGYRVVDSTDALPEYLAVELDTNSGTGTATSKPQQPYPEGYFDRPPVVTVEEAERRFGVRPKKYYLGRPMYSPEEMKDPRFRTGLPPEPEWAEEVAEELARRDANLGHETSAV